MRAENELNEATAADERNPFATPERVAETADVWKGADAWQFADAPPTVGPSFFGAFWYCLRRLFDFKGRANRTEYFGWLAGSFVALFALGGVAGLGLLVPFAWAREKGIPLLFLGVGLAFSLAASVPDAAVWTRRLRDRNVGASWKTALGGYAAILATTVGVAVCDFILLGGDNEPGEKEGMILVAATGAILCAATSTIGWAPTIWAIGFGAARLVTTPEQASNATEVIVIIATSVLLALFGILVRVFAGLRAGTPGPNRFGAERLTPQEAKRREQAQNAEEV